MWSQSPELMTTTDFRCEIDLAYARAFEHHRTMVPQNKCATQSRIDKKVPHIMDQTARNVSTPDDERSFTLTHVLRHGTPFVLLVDADGVIHAADRRPGWRALVSLASSGSRERISGRLVRMLATHASRHDARGTATIALLVSDVVVSVVHLDGPGELLAFSIAHLKREDILAAAQRRYDLTRRETELLELILRGDQSADIAKALNISLATVEWHTKRLLLKTESQNRTQMTARVLGWVCDT